MRNQNLLSGPVAPVLVSLSLPMLAGQAFNLLYNLVDTYFIARIDSADPWLVGATGLVFPLYFVFMATSFGISGGVSSLVARAIGAGHSDELDRTAESGIFLASLASVIFLFAMYLLASPLLRLFGGSNQILAYGLEYLKTLLLMVPFMLIGAVFVGILQGEGRTKHIMVSMIIGTVTNIILDPVLIFLVGMEIAGAGLATAIGNAAGLAYLIAVFLKTESRVKIHWKVKNVSFPVIGEILRVGLPQSVMNFLASISFFFYNRIMVGINPMFLTAFTLYSRLEQIALIPIWALTSGLTAIAGQSAGANDFHRMRESSRIASFIGLGVNGVLYLGFFFSSTVLFSFFQSDTGVLDIAGRIVPWMAGASFVSIPIFMVTTVMSAAGFANRSLILNAVRIYVFNVPACILGAYVFGKDLSSVMVSIFISAILALVVALVAQKRFFVGIESGRITVKSSVSKSPVG